MTFSDLAPASAPATPRADRATAPERATAAERATILVGWAVVAAGLVALWAPKLALTGPTDPDSLMRLVEVRGYLDGRAWTDLFEPRLGAPDGTPMHWSRLVDWPIAMLVRLFDPVLGRPGAEQAALALWPVLTLLPYLWGLAAVCRRLTGPDAVLPALAFGVFAAPALGSFMPGLIDHHNVQLALTAMLLATAVSVDREPGNGTAAGVIAAVMMAIGTETLPVVAVVGLGLALAWATAPAAFAAGVRVFGLAFASGMALQRMTAVPPAEWLATPCDVASLPYVAAAVVGGIGLALLTVLPPNARPGLRVAGLFALGAAVFATVLAIAPACLRGPYAEIDPRIVPVWLDLVAEARSLPQLLAESPAAILLHFPVPILALGLSVAALRRASPRDRFAWSLVAALLAVMILVSAWQLRGAKFAAMLAVPGIVLLIGRVRTWSAGRAPLVALAALLAAYVLPNPFAHMLAAGALQRMEATASSSSGAASMQRTEAPEPAVGNSGQRVCADRARYATLAGLPTGIVLAPSNLGPAILAHTPHSVVAAPYHRNPKGILDGFAAFEGSPDEALSIARRRGATYLAACTADEETGVLTDRGPGGLLARLLAGDPPAWVEPVGADGPMRIWKVRAEDATGPRLPALSDLRPTR